MKYADINKQNKKHKWLYLPVVPNEHLENHYLYHIYNRILTTLFFILS